jgi:uncharacterized protein (TIGR02453 family)
MKNHKLCPANINQKQSMIKEETLAFYRDLRVNNSREWFESNRPRYEIVRKNYLGLASDLLAEMKLIDPTLHHLEPKDCIFRINRDIRFSKDKTPYKTHFGIVMSPRGRKLEHAGYYMHVDEEAGSFAGGGIWMPSPETLKKLRREVSDFYGDLHEIMESASVKHFYKGFDRDEGVVLSRPPKGFSPDDPALEYLKFKSYTVSSAIPADRLTHPETKDTVIEMFRAIKPLVELFNRALREWD